MNQSPAPPEISALRIRQLRRLDCCAVSDAMDRLQLTGVVSGVPQQSGNARIAGVLVTLKLGIGDPPPGPTRHLGTSAIESADSDSVIAIEQNTGLDAGCWGGLLTLGAKLRGVAGVIADGPIRDIDEARSHDFAIFSRQLTPRTARGRVVEKGTNVPITLWGVLVNPGDFAIADRSGIAFITPANIDQVLLTAEAIASREAAMAKDLLAGTQPSVVMGRYYEDMLKKPL